MSNSGYQPTQQQLADANRLVGLSPQIYRAAAGNPALVNPETNEVSPDYLNSLLGYSSGGLGALGGSPAPAAPAADPDDAAYLAANPDVMAALQAGLISSGLQHYQLFGKAEGRAYGAPAPAAPTPATPAPTPAAPQTSMYGSDPANWASFMDQGRAASTGINQMPFVFSDYDKIPADDDAARKMLYAMQAGSAAK